MMKEELDGYWYLREGDYLPEPLSNIFGGHHICKEFFQEMQQLGAIFKSREAAAKVSDKVRALLRQEALECL